MVAVNLADGCHRGASPRFGVLNDRVGKIPIDIDGDMGVVNLQVLHGFQHGIECAQLREGHFTICGRDKRRRRHRRIQELAIADARQTYAKRFPRGPKHSCDPSPFDRKRLAHPGIDEERDDYVVLVGGAPLNEEFGKAIGADAYCRDAAVAVETAKEFMAKKHNQLSM